MEDIKPAYLLGNELRVWGADPLSDTVHLTDEQMRKLGIKEKKEITNEQWVQWRYHEALAERLWKWGMENDAMPQRYESGYAISYNEATGRFEPAGLTINDAFGTILFRTSRLAQQAIDEVVLPFITACPGWGKQ